MDRVKAAPDSVKATPDYIIGSQPCSASSGETSASGSVELSPELELRLDLALDRRRRAPFGSTEPSTPSLPTLPQSDAPTGDGGQIPPLDDWIEQLLD